jgi:iron-sulfur cluster repair protein YtfE (RIC family)
MDALALIRDDHEKFRRLLGQLDETTERAIKTRTEVFEDLKKELVSHEQMEEQVFYPALREARDKAEDIVLEGFQEHHVADVLVEELTALAVDAETWGAKLAVLKENVDHHMEEEEGEMFAQARKAFSAADLEELGLRMAEVKKQAIEQLAA